MGKIIALIVQFIQWLVRSVISLCSSNSEYSPSEGWSAVSEAGQSVLDWYSDSDTSTFEKVATTYGLSYLVAPKLTTSVTEKLVDATNTFTGAVGNVVSNTASTIWDVIKSNPVLFVGAGLLVYKFFFGRKDSGSTAPPVVVVKDQAL